MWVLSDSAAGWFLIFLAGGKFHPWHLNILSFLVFLGWSHLGLGCLTMATFRRRSRRRSPRKAHQQAQLTYLRVILVVLKGFVHKNNSHLAKGHSLPIMEPIDDFRTWFCASSEKCEVMQSLKAKLWNTSGKSLRIRTWMTWYQVGDLQCIAPQNDVRLLSVEL